MSIHTTEFGETDPAEADPVGADSVGRDSAVAWQATELGPAARSHAG